MHYTHSETRVMSSVCQRMAQWKQQKKPYLNAKQRQKRLQWAKEHLNWRREDWAKVIRSDETRNSIFGSGGIKYVPRRAGKDSLPECTVPTMKHPVSIMVWGRMSKTRPQKSFTCSTAMALVPLLT